ncbi:MAG: GAF domain-containing protein [Bacteroidales bacterium]|jgi:GAF domain-containing protein|nr:GAF domain-containing protein [Bacteroidales bacterium]
MKDKETQYRLLLRQMEELPPAGRDLTAVLTDTAVLLQELFGFLWTGFYLVQGSNLVLGPFVGADACLRIPFGKGVCGTAWKERRTVVVPDVKQFAGHIACSSESKSEIVVPLFAGGNVVGVLDIDSDRINAFDDTDARFLEQAVTLIYPL